SIRIDGFLLQLLAFKMDELNAVKYKRLPEDKLHRRITSTVGDTDHFLTEIRNIVRTEQDVRILWGCEPEEAKDVKIFGLDLGQACMAGANALLPSSMKPMTKTQSPEAVTQNPNLLHSQVLQLGCEADGQCINPRLRIEHKNARPINGSESTSGLRSISDIERLGIPGLVAKAPTFLSEGSEFRVRNMNALDVPVARVAGQDMFKLPTGVWVDVSGEQDVRAVEGLWYGGACLGRLVKIDGKLTSEKYVRILGDALQGSIEDWGMG
ncbi:hypothetical protein BGZ65_004771, partial [Modicella reniformis]